MWSRVDRGGDKMWREYPEDPLFWPCVGTWASPSGEVRNKWRTEEPPGTFEENPSGFRAETWLQGAKRV